VIKFKFEIDSERFKRLPGRVKTSIVISMRETIEYAKKTAKGRFGNPGELKIRSGKLKGSIESEVTQTTNTVTGSLFTDVIYGPTHELGATIFPRKRRYLVFKIGDRWIRARKVKIPAKPFLRPSVESSIEKMEEFIGKKIKEISDR